MTLNKGYGKLRLERSTILKQIQNMDNYLIDREALGQFVDELMKKKPLPANTAEELTTLREENIKALDDKIGMAIFGSLTTPQLEEFNQILDRGEESPEVFQNFFQNAGIDLQKTIGDAMTTFGKQFLGGQNE